MRCSTRTPAAPDPVFVPSLSLAGLRSRKLTTTNPRFLLTRSARRTQFGVVTPTSKLHCHPSERSDHLWVSARRRDAGQHRRDAGKRPLNVTQRHFDTCPDCNDDYAAKLAATEQQQQRVGASPFKPYKPHTQSAAARRGKHVDQHVGWQHDETGSIASGDSQDGVPCSAAPMGYTRERRGNERKYNYDYSRGTSVETNPVHGRRFDLAPG